MRKVRDIFLVILFVFPCIYVHASGETISVNCPSTATVSSVIECSVVGNSGSGGISALEGIISISDNLELVSFTVGKEWQGDASNGKIDLYSFERSVGGVFDVGIFKLKVKDSTPSSVSLLLSDVVYYSDNFNDTFSLGNASDTVKIVSSNNYLSNLSLVGGTLSPSFDKNTTSYSATIDSDKVVINAIAEDQKATISGVGSKNLSYGNNTFTISVTSESGAVKKYTIVITRPDNRPVEKEEEKKEETKKEETKKDNTSSVVLSGDNKLKSLEIEGYKIDFKASTLNYSIDVDSDVNSLKVKAVANSSKAKVTVSGDDKIVSGENKIIVSVMAENGKELEYIIIVNKKIISKVLLKSLEVEGYKIDFKSDNFEYELEIENEDMLNIKAIPSLEDAKVTILNNSELKNNSIIEIKVSYEGNESIYKLNIKKEQIVEEQEKYSDNDKAKLTILTILGVLLIVVSISGLTFKIIHSIKSRKQEND